jgi:isopenicillin-N epimerase
MTVPTIRSPLLDDALAALRSAPRDESRWDAVRALYRDDSGLANLENGFWGVMAEPVKDEVLRWTEHVNAHSTAFIRAHWADEQERVRHAVAAALGCDPEEVALTRGATETLLALIGGYNRLRPGDTVIYSDLDYPAMKNAMEWLRDRRGVTPVSFAIPEPATREGVLAAYADMLARHPRTRLVLLTHLSHCTGLVLPVREIAELARAAGAEVIVDAAHSWGQMDFGVRALGAPYVGLNLHKWIGAPLGCGALYIAKGHLDAIDPYFGDRDFPADDIRSRLHTGTPGFAAWLSVPAALELHQAIGPADKAVRLRQLRDHWVGQARAIPGVQILTPDDADSVAGMTSFRLAGRRSAQDNEAIVAALRDTHGVLTVRRTGPAAGDVVRVTPSLHTTHADLDRLVAALRVLAA